ncbi:MAG: hypothetical protein M3Z33_08200 [Actinomycetota bacterium]|nr:hypothetical protein [Actinomycetota bacterium]
MGVVTPSNSRPARLRAERVLADQLLQAPATHANTARNARAELRRQARWAPARDAVWRLLDAELTCDARVAVLGAGNGDSVPLQRIASRVRHVALVDLDETAIRTARRRQPRQVRRRIELIRHDITNGAADRIATAVATGQIPAPPRLHESPVPGAPYDLVIGDLLYSQLLYPALIDLDVPAMRRDAVISRYAPMLTRSTVGRLHVSTPYGRVLHIHDPIAWWPGHPQPVSLRDILATAERDPRRAIRLAAEGAGPHHSDPRAALRTFSIPIRATALWHWPFAPGVDYLACATLAGAPR